MSAWGRVTDLVLLTLADLGRATVADIAETAGLPAESVRKALQRAVSGPPDGRRAHVVAWVRDCEGQRAYPRPVYRAGRGKNKRRPAPKHHTDSTREMARRAQALMLTVRGHMPQKEARLAVSEMRRRGLL